MPIGKMLVRKMHAGKMLAVKIFVIKMLETKMFVRKMPVDEMLPSHSVDLQSHLMNKKIHLWSKLH